MQITDDLWWFDGETQAYYSTQVTLSLDQDHRGDVSQSYEWTINSGGSIVRFSNGGTTYVTGNYVEVELHSIGASAPAASLTFDISIQVVQNGAPLATAQVAVPRPNRLVHLGNTDAASANWGYESRIGYRIEDQFNRVLPRRVGVNENWTTDVVNDFAGTNWRRGPAGGETLNPAGWVDRIQGEAVGFGFNPAPQNPQNPLGNVRVQHWGQAWFVGSTMPGVGRRVQTNTLQKFQDHARHEGVTSPP